MFATNDPNLGLSSGTLLVRKRPGGRTTAVLTGVLATLFWCETTAAGTFGTPSFVVSSINDSNVISISPVKVVNQVIFSGTARQSIGIAPIPEAHSVVTDGSASVTGGFTDISSINSYKMEGTPSAFEAKVLNLASTNGIGETAFVNTGVSIEQWYVLNGPGSGAVTLRMDVAFQGQLTALGTSAPRAFFNGTVVLASRPGATSLTVPLALDSHLIAVGDDPNAFNGNAHTVPGVVSTSDITINEIIRSNPFTVDIGVPFGLGFSLGAAATTGGADATAESNFFDPMLASSLLFPGIPQLTPDGFGIDTGGGNVDLLSSQGLTLQTIPEPGALALFGTGLAGLVFARRRRKLAA